MSTTPVHVLARWTVKAGQLATVLTLLRTVRAQTLAEPGNLFYTIHQSEADANVLLLYEGYADAAAQQAHTQSGHFQQIVVQQIVPLLEAREVTLAKPLEL